MKKVEIGLVNQAKVIRKSDLGYMLNIANEEVLLHFNQATSELQTNQEVNVFVFYDKQGRLSASMEMPLATLTTPAWLEVVESVSKLGVFVYNNHFKDILVSVDYLPYNEEAWPVVGSKLFCMLKLRKKQLTAKPLNKYEIADLKKPVTTLELNTEVKATVIKVGQAGIGLITEDFHHLFVYSKYLRKRYRLGDVENVRIINSNDDGYNCSLIKNKELMIDDDALTIYNYLMAHQNKMAYGNHSSPEEIYQTFRMSKKAFKRALGSLYKAQKIAFDDKETILKEKL